jgi:MFS family permease
MFLFHPKHQIVTRSYDVAGQGYLPLDNKPKEPGFEEKQFVWTVAVIKNFSALFTSIFLSALAYGIMTVMIAFKLEANVKNEVLMAISGIVQIGAGVLFSRFLPDLGRKVGMINSLFIGSFVSAVCALLLYVYPGYVLWLVLIYFLGTSFFICGVTRNTIMIDMAPRHIKGMIISFGGMLVAFGNSMGPVILNVFQLHDGILPLLLAFGFFIVSMLPLIRLKNVVTDIREEKKIGLGRYIANSPKIMLAGFCVSYCIASINAFLVIYGIKIGMSKAEASLLLSAFLFGTVFSIPLGYLTDIFNRRFMMIFSATMSLICIAANCFNSSSQSLHVFLFVLFGLLMGMKLPAVILINEKYKPTQRLAVNSAFSRFCLLGNIFGLFCTGIAFSLVGAQGMWLSVMMSLGFFLLFCANNYRRKFLRGELNFKNFSILNKHQHEPEFEI